MALRFSAAHCCRIAFLLTAMSAAAPPSLLAQDLRATPPKAQKKPPEAPGKLPKVGADKSRGLDFLFGALKAAPDEASAKHVEARIWALWTQTPSDTTALLMLRAKAAMDAQQTDVALKLLDAVVKLRPDYVEGWNRRATLYYLKNDYTHSLQDIEQVLVREPRHFGALAGLGMIMQDLGDEKRALDAFRKALAVNPHLEKVPELVKTLTEKVEGRDI
jgi:tetratricopeptide (TPR) repeat protein